MEDEYEPEHIDQPPSPKRPNASGYKYIKGMNLYYN